MAVPVRPDLSEENLRQILAEGHESETLDYKSYCDLSNKHERVELAKDIAAMQMDGGYIVIGANDDGRPSGRVEQNHLRAFEQASLRKTMLSYLSEPLELLAKSHELDDNRYILIYVGPSDDCLSIIKGDGHNAKGQLVFQPGDVFARHGTSSERWNQHDIAKVNAKLAERLRERILKEAAEAFAASLPSAASVSIAAGPAGALSWQLDIETFLDVVTELIRRGDLIPLKLLLTGIPTEVGPLLTEDDAEEKAALVLDRLTCLASLVLRLDEDKLFRSVIGGFVAVYDLLVDGRGEVRSGLAIRREPLWFMILQRISAIGALAERLKKWDAIRFMVLQQGRGWEFKEGDYRNWYRHALTMSSRADLLVVEKEGRRREWSLLAFALEQIERLDCLRPDLPAGDEGLLDSLCRFDLLACLVAIDAAGAPRGSDYYPNFARYHSSRAARAAAALLEDREMRNALFNGGDEKLAEALAELNRAASAEAPLIFGWDGYDNDKVERFIEEYAPKR